MFKDKKILVCGGSGFLGTNLILRLQDQGCQILATHYESEPKTTFKDNVTFIKADLRDPALCARACEGMDYVFHFAANTAGAAVMVNTPLAHVTPNILMNTQLLEAAHRAGVKRFLFLSSGAAYPQTTDHPMREDEMFKDDPLDVYYAVAWMKRYTEILCKTYATKIKNPMPVIVVRPSNVYGTFDKYDPAKSHVTASIVRRVAQGENPMNMWGNGEDIRDLIHIDDFMDGVLLAFEKGGDYLAINICSGTGHSVKEVVATALKAASHSDVEVTYDPTKPSTAPKVLLDNSLAKKLLGFEAKISLAEGMKRAIDWYRSNHM